MRGGTKRKREETEAGKRGGELRQEREERMKKGNSEERSEGKR